MMIKQKSKCSKRSSCSLVMTLWTSPSCCRVDCFQPKPQSFRAKVPNSQQAVLCRCCYPVWLVTAGLWVTKLACRVGGHWLCSLVGGGSELLPEGKGVSPSRGLCLWARVRRYMSRTGGSVLHQQQCGRCCGPVIWADRQSSGNNSQFYSTADLQALGGDRKNEKADTSGLKWVCSAVCLVGIRDL